MAWSTADVEALFVQAGLGEHIATEVEDANTRLERIANQLNSGSRTIEEVQAAIDGLAAQLAESGNVFFDESGAVRYGGGGAAELQSRTGANAEVWRESDTGMAYLVYFVPGTDVPLLYSADQQQLQALFTDAGQITFDRELTSGQIAQLGGLRAGDVSDPRENPYEELLTQLEAEAEVRPWLRDAEVLAVITEAAIEGRPVSEAELQQTEWWRSRTEGQRQWALLVESDPATAAQEIQATEISTLQSLRALGVNNASAELVSLLAKKVTTGEWSTTKYNNQLRAIADPYSGIPIDGALSPVLSRDLDTTLDRTLDVKNLAARWLGPAYGQMSEEQVKKWAGQFRNDPDAESSFVEMLQKQRMALFPEYTDPNLTYEDIAAPWRNLVFRMWGQQPDETGGMFNQILRMNDLTAAEQMLRREGLKQGVSKVGNDLISALGATSVGQQVRGL